MLLGRHHFSERLISSIGQEIGSWPKPLVPRGKDGGETASLASPASGVNARRAVERLG
jgi:hypothetical protein